MYASGPQPEGCNPSVADRLLENRHLQDDSQQQQN